MRLAFLSCCRIFLHRFSFYPQNLKKVHLIIYLFVLANWRIQKTLCSCHEYLEWCRAAHAITSQCAAGEYLDWRAILYPKEGRIDQKQRPRALGTKPSYTSSHNIIKTSVYRMPTEQNIYRTEKFSLVNFFQFF